MVLRFSYYTVAVVALVGCHLTLWHVPDGFCQAIGSGDITARIRTYKAQLAADGFQIETRLQLAKTYLQIEAYTEAVDMYRQVLTTVGVDTVAGKTNNISNSDIPAEAYYGLGLAHTGLEKFEDAIAAYQRAIIYRPDWAYSRAALASAYASTHRYAEALDAYKIAIKLDPTDEMIHHQLGNVYSKRGDSTAAMRHQQQAIVIAPEFAVAHYQLGLLYAQEKQWSDAITSYRAAYAYDATLVEVLYNLAQAYLRAGDTAAAREQMVLFEKQKATLDPLHQLRGALQRTQETGERAQILANIGRVYLTNGLYEEAVWEYQKALGMNAALVPAYNGIGIAYTMLERYPEAIVAQQKALELQPDFAKAYAGLGLAYFRQNEVELALEHYRCAISLAPDLLDAHLKIGIILLNQERYAEAVDAYKATLVLAPDNAEIHHNLGLCYAHQAKAATDDVRQLSDAPSAEDLTNAALVALEKAVTLSLSNVNGLEESEQSSGQPVLLKETYYLIGEMQAGKRDFNAAETAYLASGLPKAYHALARLSAKFATENKKNNKHGVDLEAARRYAQETIRLDPNVATYYNTLALIEFRRGDYLEAEKVIRKALALDPENPNYHQGLKKILGKLGSKEQD